MISTPNRKARRAAATTTQEPAPPAPSGEDPRSKAELAAAIDDVLAFANEMKGKRDELEMDLFKSKRATTRLAEQVVTLQTQLDMLKQSTAAPAAQPAAPAAQHEEPING